MEILVMIGKMVLESTFGKMGTNIKETFAKIWGKVKDKCTGSMVAHIMGNGKEDYLMEKVNMDLSKLGIFTIKGEKPR